MNCRVCWSSTASIACTRASSQGVAEIAKAANGQVTAIRDELIDLEREIRHLADHFDTSRTLDSLVGDDEVGADHLLESVGHVLVDGVGELTERLDQQLQASVLKDAGGLRSCLARAATRATSCPATIRAIARTTVINLMKTMDVADLMFSRGQQVDNDATTLAESLASANPRLMRCGGAKRLLVMLPNGSTNVQPLKILHEQMNETPSVAQNSDGDFILCYEVEQISLTQVAVTIIDGRQDYAEFANRFHTRTDVDWSTLPDIA